MSYTAETPIRGTTGVTLAQAVAYATRKVARGPYPEYLRFVWRHAPGLGLNPLVVMAQWMDETAGGTSAAWLGGNPAGIGMPPGGANPFPPGLTGQQSAAIHLAELHAKVSGDLEPVVGGVEVESIDPHWGKLAAVLQRPDWPSVRTLADLAKRFGPGNQEAVWATNRRYPEQLAAHMNAIAAYAKERPMARGHVPQPPWMQHYQARVNAVAGQNCTIGPRKIVGSCSHTEVGYFTGTTQHFDNPANGALTDFQIGGPWDGLFDGVIMRYIEDDQPVIPYANGTIGKGQPPFGDGLRFVQRFGYGEAINAMLRSVERSDAGQPNRMDHILTGRQTESWCFLLAYIHSEEAGQAWDAFDWHLYHYESGTDHEGCPGAWAKANAGPIMQRVQDIMKAYQTFTRLSRPLTITYPPGWTGPAIAQPGTGTVEPPPPPPPGKGYAESVLPDWWGADLAAKHPGDRTEDGVRYRVMRRNFRVKIQTTRRSAPDPKARVAGPTLPVGAKLYGERLVEKEGETRPWILTTDGFYVLASKLSPTVTIEPW